VNATSASSDKSTAAAVGLVVAAGGEVAAHAIESGRTLAALPRARANGQTRLWATQLVMLHSTNTITPPRGGWHGMWGHSFRAVKGIEYLNAFGAAGVAVPHLLEALRENGAGGVVTNPEGRTGAIAAVAGAVNLGIMGTAMGSARGAGPRAALSAAIGSEMLGKRSVVALNLGTFAGVIANELGAFDFLNG